LAHAQTQPGTFTISLDFELYWGIRDKADLDACTARLLGARDAVPRLLDMFARSAVHATWATVGFLFFDEKDELLAHLPAPAPRYLERRLFPYDHVLRIGPNEQRDPFHYARSLILRIVQYPGQEVGTHTFSHYYCLEPGQTLEEFRADLDAANAAARRLGIELKSLVFPRNQWCPEYLTACAETGIRALRGCEQAWMYRPTSGADSVAKRAFRLVDSYVNISGHHGHKPIREQAGVTNLPSSRFLRTVPCKPARLASVHVHRIRKSMDHAARHGLLFHLWWHPHNFGARTDENLRLLGSVLEHFEVLRKEYGMVSRSMGELIQG
jgi:hypothetical protein